MKALTTILFFILFATSNTIAQNDTDAAKLLETISNKYKEVESYQLDVELVINVPEVEKSIVIQSEVWLKGDMYKIEFEEKIILSNTISEWIYLKDVNELQINHYDPSAMAFLPSKLFNINSKEYLFRLTEEFKNSKGELIKKIELTPLNKDLEIFKIIATINTRTNEIVEARMFEKTGYQYSYKILSVDTGVKLADSFFTFDLTSFEIDVDDITDLR